MQYGVNPVMEWTRRLALGAGDFGLNLYWQTASLYLMYFYTDVLGLPAAIAGTIYMVALIVDATLDPIVGLFADRTHSRYGRYRPYLLFGGVPLGLLFLAMFAGPGGAGSAPITYAALTHVAFRACYALISIPYAALFARVTQDARVRTDLTAFRMVFAALSAVAVAAFTLPLVRALDTPESPRRGWELLALGFAACAVVVLLLVAWATRGYDGAVEEPRERLPLAPALRSLCANRALLVVLGAAMISSFCSTLFSKNLIYYFKYVVGKPEMGGNAMAFIALLVALFVPVWALVARRIGKRNAWLVGGVPGLLGLCLWHFGDGNISLLFGALSLQALGTGAYIVCYWAMLPDTVEYGEWRSGIRTESLVFGLAVLGLKVALGFGAGFLGLALSRIGYVPNAEQSPATLEGIKELMFWIPLCGNLGSFVLVWFYPLNLADHARIVGEIAARSGARRSSTTSSAPM